MVLSSWTGKAIRKKKITLPLPPAGSAQSHKKSAPVLSFPDYTHKVLRQQAGTAPALAAALASLPMV